MCWNVDGEATAGRGSGEVIVIGGARPFPFAAGGWEGSTWLPLAGTCLEGRGVVARGMGWSLPLWRTRGDCSSRMMSEFQADWTWSMRRLEGLLLRLESEGCISGW